MRFIWSRGKASPQARMDRLHFVMWDFLKMLTLAALCGLGVSVGASLLVLLLSTPAEARQPVRMSPEERSVERAPVPGSLLIGDGCGSDALPASERDWHVSVLPGRIEVRVMQTFHLPEDPESLAVFQAQLPVGATLKSFNLSSGSRERSGLIKGEQEMAALTPAAFRRLTRDQVIVATDPAGLVLTSPLLGLPAGAPLIVQYVYVLPGSGVQSLALPLQPAEALPLANDMPAHDAPEGNSIYALSVGAAVWVEWIGAQPVSVSAPVGADIDRPHTRIRGISWAAQTLAPGQPFLLSWSM